VGHFSPCWTGISEGAVTPEAVIRTAWRIKSILRLESPIYRGTALKLGRS
jgi:hypothetical protein